MNSYTALHLHLHLRLQTRIPIANRVGMMVMMMILLLLLLGLSSLDRASLSLPSVQVQAFSVSCKPTTTTRIARRRFATATATPLGSAVCADSVAAQEEDAATTTTTATATTTAAFATTTPTTTTTTTASYHDNNDSVLARLFGSAQARDDFFANDFGKNVVHLRNRKRNRSSDNTDGTDDTDNELDDVCSLDLPCIERIVVEESTSTDNANVNANVDANVVVKTRLDLKVLFESSELIALRKRGSTTYIDNTDTSYDDFCDYISNDNGSAVIPVAGESVLVPFLDEVREDFTERLRLRFHDETEHVEHNHNHASNAHNASNAVTTAAVVAAPPPSSSSIVADTLEVGINVYHSGPGAVALNRHVDQYDVLVVHLDGRKQWEIGVYDDDDVDNNNNNNNKYECCKDIDRVDHWTNVTLVPGDLLYIPEGVFHAATTADGYDSTTHATISLDYRR